MRRPRWLALSGTALIVLGNCTGAATTPDRTSAKKDVRPSIGLEPASRVLDAPPRVPKEGGVVNADLTTQTCGTPFTATANSGKACTTDESVCTANELCVGGFKNAAGQEVAMCLGKCCYDASKTWNDPVNLCPVTDKTKMFAICDLILQDNSNVCGWYCEYKDTSGAVVQKDCPGTAYDCVVVFSSDPTTKYCVPKQ